MKTEYTDQQIAELLGMYQELKSDSDLQLTCLEGKEGGRVTYSAKVPVEQLLRHFSLVPQLAHKGAAIRIQRELTKARENNIANYIKENDLYLFPQLVAITEDFDVKPTTIENVVTLTIKADCFRYLTDLPRAISRVRALYRLG